MLVGIAVLLLWSVVVRLLVRPFGVRLPLGLVRLVRSNGTSPALTLPHYIWLVGVLFWGCGMFIVTTLGEYVDWGYWNGSSHKLSAGILLFRALAYLIGGLVFGWMTWRQRAEKAS